MSPAENIIATPEGRTPSRRQPRPARLPRKKACEECSIAKARCDTKKPVCSRCESRQFNCNYAASQGLSSSALQAAVTTVSEISAISESVQSNAAMGASSENTPGRNESGFVSSSSATFDDHDSLFSLQSHPTSIATRGTSYASERRPEPEISNARVNLYWPDEDVNFANLHLVCPIDASKIRNRWLGDFIPFIDQRVKNYPSSIILLISRVLKTYPGMLLQERHLPPFIHPAQLSGPEMPTPLANCLSLIRMWDGQVRGSENLMGGVILNEMKRIYEVVSRDRSRRRLSSHSFIQRATYDQMNQLAAFQAYLMYAIMLFFADSQLGQLIDRQVMINLQDFACEVANSGLVCPEELSHSRPEWESWIVASIKRRALYTMYMFDNVFCSRNGLPSFLGEELEGLLAPASKTLWEASERAAWNIGYNRYLHDWPSGGLRIDDLWPPPETGSEGRRKRVEKWLTDVDEFGMMLFAVTLVTHGG